jgi:hypothetical protein
MDYWAECIEEAFDDAEIEASDEQTQTVIDWVKGAFENYNLATGIDCIPNPLRLENDSLRAELEKERGKAVCPDCGGTGESVTHGPVHSGISECSRCRGEGKC